MSSEFEFGCRNLNTIDTMIYPQSNVYSILKRDILVLSVNAANQLQDYLLRHV